MDKYPKHHASSHLFKITGVKCKMTYLKIFFFIFLMLSLYSYLEGATSGKTFMCINWEASTRMNNAAAIQRFHSNFLFFYKNYSCCMMFSVSETAAHNLKTIRSIYYQVFLWSAVLLKKKPQKFCVDVNFIEIK